MRTLLLLAGATPSGAAIFHTFSRSLPDRHATQVAAAEAGGEGAVIPIAGTSTADGGCDATRAAGFRQGAGAGCEAELRRSGRSRPTFSATRSHRNGDPVEDALFQHITHMRAANVIRVDGKTFDMLAVRREQRPEPAASQAPPGSRSRANGC